jgi:protein kinase C substrate 80K-H
MTCHFVSHASMSTPKHAKKFPVYQFEAYLPKSLRDWADQKLRELRQVLVENGILAAGDKAPTTTESKAVADARSALDLAKSTLIQVSNQLSTAREDLNKDYGPDSIFLALKGKCVSKDSGEYTYELCWLDRTSQKSKKGGGETNMGNFRGLEKVMVDDEIRADGRSLGSGERIAMRYDGGQHCWNGPSRSTLVVLGCSETEEIWKITEEEKCVYRMEVGTAAVCEQEGGKKVDGQVYAKEGKDEL